MREINYWDCEYQDYDEQWNGEQEICLYICTHPYNEIHNCILENKFAGEKDMCVFLNGDYNVRSK